MKESLHIQEGYGQKAATKMSRLLVTGLVAFVLASCGSVDSEKIDGKLSDIESELLTRGERQREINREGNIYNNHYGHGDEKQISKMDEGAFKRSSENREEYNDLLEERNRLLRIKDRVDAKNHNRREKHYYDEREFENSDSAIVEAIRNRK